MLSRPFYQPFNIIGSRVRSLACAAQITSDQERTRGGTVLLRSSGLTPLFAADDRRAITRVIRYEVFILPITFALLSALSANESELRAKFREVSNSPPMIYESLKKCMNIIIFEPPLLKSPKIPCCDRVEISITENYTNFFALFVEINFYMSHFVFDRIDLLNVPDTSFYS